MDKARTLDQFWSSFGLLAFDENSGYDETLDIPDRYITYEVQTGNFGDPVALTASLWYRSASWAEISRKADEIAAYIGYGGRMIAIDGGYLWVKLRSPFAQRMPVEQEDGIRRIVLNITVDFLTAV